VFGAWVRRDEFVRVLPEVLALGTPPPVASASAEFLDRLARQRRSLSQFYEAGLAAYKGDRGAWARALDAALRADPANPYFRWIAQF
jgi:spermidine synthase